MNIIPLKNPRKSYSWGSRHSLQRLLNEKPGSPLAEIWMGTHPSSPSLSVDGTSLREIVQESGDEVSFLMKLLAADEGLSIQAHPSREQAAAGFEEEESHGIPVEAAHRVFRDRNHKPELIVALEPFWAMSGFRPIAEAASMLSAFGILPADSHPNDLSTILRCVLDTPPERVRGAVESEAISGAQPPAERPRGEIDDSLRFSWVGELYRQFGDDPGVLAPLFLNLVYLEPGSGLFQPSGVLHAYLRGTGVELMAESDNVLRAGLTKKHIDVDGLLNVVRFESETPAVLAPRVCDDAERPLHAEGSSVGALCVYDTPAPDFRLYHVELRGEAVTINSTGTPLIALSVSGMVSVSDESDTVSLGPGSSCYISSRVHRFTLSGSGAVYIASRGEGSSRGV